MINIQLESEGYKYPIQLKKIQFEGDKYPMNR